jgi:hypothetical protein
MLASPEYFGKSGGANDAWLNQVYEDILGRPRDPGSQSLLTSLNNGGASRQQVAGMILSSSEFRTRLVGSYYVTYLGRLPGAEEAGRWVISLHNGARHEDVLSQILSSTEYYLREHAFP